MSEVANIEQNIISGRDVVTLCKEALQNEPNAFFGDSEVCPLKHSFSDGIYVREIFIPAGTKIVGKIHKHEHPNFLMQGKVQVFTEQNGFEELEAPLSMISSPGTQRALMAHTDTVWVTIHKNPTNTQDLVELEEMIIAKSFDEYDKFIESTNNKIIDNKMEHGIINCGLVALKKISDFKKISAKTILSIAEDNGIKLSVYNVLPNEVEKIKFPVIGIYENHFEFISNIDEFEGRVEHFTGRIISEVEQDLYETFDAILDSLIGETWVGVGVTAVGVGYSIYSNVREKNKAKKATKKLMGENHDFNVDPNYAKNQSLAEYMAQNGMGEQALQFYKNQNARQLSASNEAVLNMGGGINDVNRNFAASQAGLESIAAKDALMKQDNLKTLMDQNIAVAGQNTMKWAIGYKNWKDQLAIASNTNAQANENIAKGVVSLGQLTANGIAQSNNGGSGSNSRTMNTNNNTNTYTPSSQLFDPNFNGGVNSVGNGTFDIPKYNYPIDENNMPRTV